MKSTYESRPRAAFAVGIVGALVIGNILSNRVVPAAFYVPTNLLVTATVVLLARFEVGARDVGLTQWRRGAVWGGTVVAAGVALYLTASLLPPTRGLFDDSRVDGDLGRMLYEVFIRIPSGTVILEETAFRGVLPAVLARHMSTVRAVVVSSLLFGFWHVLPSLSLSEVNPVLGDILGEGLAAKIGGVVFAVVGTFLVGLWLSFLRHRSGSLLAPVLVHTASNSVAYAMAWFIGGAGIQGSIGRL
ncbi:CPBP family intramembrane glutamic endopeptidase [Desertimonas flava]|uniref:CPBP family intramembrane glutamic endopeptidase n=1 Tax=Desertimonas flava TaxID=2064846 RepID=UPI0013C40C04|nr:type II CAAX endopeptidase family protein [Desertimonas flava]